MPTVRFQVPYVFLVLAHDRRRILHFGVTAHATAEWTAQQLREAFPWDSAPGYLLRDRGSAPTARSMDLCATPPFAQSSQVLSIVDSIDMLAPSSRNCVFFRHSLCGCSYTLRRSIPIALWCASNSLSWPRRDSQSPHFRDEGCPLEPKLCGCAVRSTDNPVGLTKSLDDECPVCVVQRAHNAVMRFWVG